ncbi:MAG: NAD(+)/NADH kinase [Candidatus Nezhaarchaeales archaeon]
MGQASIGLVSRTDSAEALNIANTILRYLHEKGVKWCVEKETANVLKLHEKAVPLNEMDADVIVVIGGDGTLLRAFKNIPKASRPILGIRVGRSGFLSDIMPENALQAIEEVLKGNYQVEVRARLRVTVNDKVTDALNEALITSSRPAKVIGVKVLTDNTLIFEGWLDGVIFATTTGATGYALSANGPVVDPDLDVIVMVPINPLNLSLRPFVISINKRLSLKLVEPSPPANIIVDGYSFLNVGVKETVNIFKSPQPATFLRLHAYRRDFYEKLREIRMRMT